MNDLNNYKKQRIINYVENLELQPILEEEIVNSSKYTRIPLSKISSVGVAFEPLVAAIQNVFGEGSNTQICRVTKRKGTHCASKKDGTGYIGTLLNDKNQIAGQAVIKPLVCDPTMIFMSAVLLNFDKKMDIIQEQQKEIMDFLVQKEKAEMKSNLLFLVDILNSFKYNWNNELYKQSNHVKVLDIRLLSEKSILFYRQDIINKTRKKKWPHIQQDVKHQIEQILDSLRDYKLAVYLYAFSYFLEVLLLGNYDHDYLSNVVNKINENSIQYKEFYTSIYTGFEYYSKSSVESTVLNGLKDASNVAGDTIGKVPFLNMVKVDDLFRGAGSKFKDFDQHLMNDTLKGITVYKHSGVWPFIKNLKIIDQVYNQSMEIWFDSENIYYPNV